MAGEGSGGGGGDGSGSGGGGDGGAGPDVGAILAYLNYQNWFSKDGDYTGNAGYYGDNIGPVGSREPDRLESHADALLKTLMEPPGRAPGAPRQPGSSLSSFVGAAVDAYSGLPLNVEYPDPFTGWPAGDPFSGAPPFAALPTSGLLSSPELLAQNDLIPSGGTGSPRLPDVRRDFGTPPAAPATPSADWQEEIKRLAGEQRYGPALAYIDGQLRSLPSYTTKEIVIYAGEQDSPASALPVPPQQAPPAPDHRYGLYVFRKAAEQLSEQSTRAFKERRYVEGLVGLGLNAFVSSVADLENLMPYNAPDHFLSAGQYAQRWIWYDMRGQSGRGLLELAKGQDQAGAALGGAELALSFSRSLMPSGLQLDASFTTTDRATVSYYDRNNILRIQQNTGNAYSYDTKTNARAVAKTLMDFDASKPGAAIYVGSGGHGTSGGVSFVTEGRLREPAFYAQDVATVKNLQEIGIGRVLDLSNPAEAQIFKNAEQMALEPGQDAVFTVRAWCFSSRTCF